MLSDVLPVLAALSRALQARDDSYSFVGSLVSGTVSTVKALRDQPGEHFSCLPVVMTRLIEQPFRFHKPTETEVDNFQNKVYREFMDSVVKNLEKRFPNIEQLEAFSVFYPQQWPEDSDKFEEFGKQEIQMIADRFQSSLECPEDVLPEFRLFKHAIKRDSQLEQQSAHRVMEEITGPLADTLPNLAKLAAVGLLIPASTADCERGFSALMRIKNQHRVRLNENTLKTLLLISVEGPVVLQDIKKRA